MRYDSEHKQRTRRKVIHQAAATIRERGPDGIGVAGIMAKAGLTHGGFYAHFKSKDDLIAAAITHMFDDRYEVFRACMEGAEPGQGLATFIDGYLCKRHRDAPQRGCPLPSLSGDLARMPAAARKSFEAGTERLKQSMAAVLRALHRPDPDALAGSVLAEMVGALVLSRAVADAALSERILESSRAAINARLGLGAAREPG